MVNDSGVFLEFTDYQNVIFSNLINLQDKNLNKYLGVEGKTIEQLYSEIEDESLKKALESLKKNGFEKIKIIEVVEGKNGFDAIVLQDVNGDYNIFYPCTNVNEFDDILYDTYNVIKYIIAQGNLDKKAIKEIEQLANIFLGKDIYYL